MGRSWGCGTRTEQHECRGKISGVYPFAIQMCFQADGYFVYFQQSLLGLKTEKTQVRNVQNFALKIFEI